MTDETIGNVPILVLGNKIDKTEAVSEEKLRELFGLYGQTTGKVRRSLHEHTPPDTTVPPTLLPVELLNCTTNNSATVFIIIQTLIHSGFVLIGTRHGYN